MDAFPAKRPETVIRFAAASKSYRVDGTPVPALHPVDLEIAKGEVFGIIGHSGAGKSTLLRLINLLERPTSGQVLIDGRDVTHAEGAELRRLRAGIGMIFQHFNLLSSRTVFDNVALPLEIAGTAKAEIAARVERLLALVGLADKSERYPAELSGGQKQRVGIARALATDPKVLLCDEATSALDPETTKAILALLKQVNRELGITILLITHEIPVIKEICDRVAVIDGGRIVEEGETFSVFTRPRHPTTASFVEAVTGVEIPAHLADAVRQTLRPGDSAVLRIAFSGENATAPVISRLSSVVGVDVNILAGRIDAIAGRPYGSLLVSVPAAEPNLGAVLGALKTLELKAEVLGYVA